MTALAVIAGLVAALFVALQSVSAAACAANPNITLDIGASCEVNHDDAVATGFLSTTPAVATVAAATDPEDGFTITAVAVGTTTVRLFSDLGSDNAVGGTGDAADTVATEFGVTVAGFGIAKLEVVDDPDATISAGPQIKVRATLRSGADAAIVRLTVPSTGLSIHLPGALADDPTDDSTTQTQTKAASDASGNTRAVAEFDVNTAGAPAGEYVLTFTADNDANFTTRDGATEATKQATDTLTVTIGEPGTGVSSATLSLGNETEDIPYTADDETVPESGTAAANGGDIKVVIEVFDSLGGKASGAAINQITIFAHGGTIASSFDDDVTSADTSIADGVNSINLSEARGTDGALTTSDVGQKTTVTITKTDKKPGTVVVRAFVAGPGGGAQTQELTLIFAGSAASLTVADATESLLSANPADADEDDTIRLEVTAADASGNKVDPPISGVAITITDPEGKRVQTTAISHSQPTKSKGKFYITLTGKGTATSPLAAGNYTLKARSGKLEAEASFAVAGAAANIELDVSSSPDPVALGSVITVVATVTDKDGNTVADGTPVDFSTGGALKLTDVGNVMGVKTKGGEAKARFIASEGSGLAVIIVDSGAASETASVSVAPAAAAEEEPEEVSLDCLSSTTGFATYSCSMDSSASELFGLLAGRGASAIHLWNGSAWVRYSMVDGAMVPGSMDFTVTEDDILYISN